MRTLTYKKIVYNADSKNPSELPSSLNNSLILEGGTGQPITAQLGNVLFGPVISLETTPISYNQAIHSITDYVPDKGLFILNKKPIVSPDVLWFENENVVFYKIYGVATAASSYATQAVKVKAKIDVGSDLTYEDDLGYYIFPCNVSLAKGDKIILTPGKQQQYDLKAPVGRYDVVGDLTVKEGVYVCCKYVDTPNYFYVGNETNGVYQTYYYYVTANTHEVEVPASSLKKAVLGDQTVYVGTIKSSSLIFEVELIDAESDYSKYTINGKTATIQIHENDYDNVTIKYVCSDIEF